MEGWIKLYRKIQESWLWKEKRKFSKFEAWIDILLQANHKNTKIIINFKVVQVKKGSFITSETKLAQKWKWDRSTVRRFLEMLEKEKMIRKNATTEYTTISIENWGLYQNEEQEKQQQDNSDTTAKQQRHNTDKNDKNDKNNIYNIYGQNEFDQTEPSEPLMEKWEEQFEQFYKQYPKKVKKKDVEKWFKKNKPSDELFSSMMSSLEQFKGCQDWLKDKGQYIPYPTSWLNQERWKDSYLGEMQTTSQNSSQEIMENIKYLPDGTYVKDGLKYVN